MAVASEAIRAIACKLLATLPIMRINTKHARTLQQHGVACIRQVRSVIAAEGSASWADGV